MLPLCLQNWRRAYQLRYPADFAVQLLLGNGPGKPWCSGQVGEKKPSSEAVGGSALVQRSFAVVCTDVWGKYLSRLTRYLSFSRFKGFLFWSDETLVQVRSVSYPTG